MALLLIIFVFVEGFGGVLSRPPKGRNQLAHEVLYGFFALVATTAVFAAMGKLPVDSWSRKMSIAPSEQLHSLGLPPSDTDGS